MRRTALLAAPAPTADLTAATGLSRLESRPPSPKRRRAEPPTERSPDRMAPARDEARRDQPSRRSPLGVSSNGNAWGRHPGDAGSATAPWTHGRFRRDTCRERVSDMRVHPVRAPDRSKASPTEAPGGVSGTANELPKRALSLLGAAVLMLATGPAGGQTAVAPPAEDEQAVLKAAYPDYDPRTQQIPLRWKSASVPWLDPTLEAATHVLLQVVATREWGPSDRPSSPRCAMTHGRPGRAGSRLGTSCPARPSSSSSAGRAWPFDRASISESSVPTAWTSSSTSPVSTISTGYWGRRISASTVPATTSTSTKGPPGSGFPRATGSACPAGGSTLTPRRCFCFASARAASSGSSAESCCRKTARTSAKRPRTKGPGPLRLSVSQGRRVPGRDRRHAEAGPRRLPEEDPGPLRPDSPGHDREARGREARLSL